MKICYKCQEKILSDARFNKDRRFAINPEKGVMYFNEVGEPITEDTVVIDVVEDHDTYCMKFKEMLKLTNEYDMLIKRKEKLQKKLLKDLSKLMKKGLIPQKLGEEVACVILKEGNCNEED